MYLMVNAHTNILIKIYILTPNLTLPNLFVMIPNLVRLTLDHKTSRITKPHTTNLILPNLIEPTLQYQPHTTKLSYLIQPNLTQPKHIPHDQKLILPNLTLRLSSAGLHSDVLPDHPPPRDAPPRRLRESQERRETRGKDTEEVPGTREERGRGIGVGKGGGGTGVGDGGGGGEEE